MGKKCDIPVFNQPIIETHFHLDYLKEDSAENLLAAARAVGVERFMTISVEPGNMLKPLELAHQFKDVYATLGVHPNEAKNLMTAPLNTCMSIALTIKSWLLAK